MTCHHEMTGQFNVTGQHDLTGQHGITGQHGMTGQHNITGQHDMTKMCKILKTKRENIDVFKIRLSCVIKLGHLLTSLQQ